MKTTMKRVIAIICMAAVLITSFPLSVFAEDTEMQNELRKLIEGGEEMKELFPNGVFTFVGTRFNISEDTGIYEIQIARQGGTQGEVTVDFKAIDVSARYGSDYVIEEPGFLWNREIPGNPDAKPLLDDLIQKEIEIVNSDNLDVSVELATSEQDYELEGEPEENTGKDNQPSEQEQQPGENEQETSDEPQDQEKDPEGTDGETQEQEDQPEGTAGEPQAQEEQPEESSEEQQEQEEQPEQEAEEMMQLMSLPEQEEEQQKDNESGQTAEEPQPENEPGQEEEKPEQEGGQPGQPEEENPEQEGGQPGQPEEEKPEQEGSQPGQPEEEPAQEESQPEQSEEEPQQGNDPGQSEKPQQEWNQPEQTADETKPQETQPELTEQELQELYKNNVATEAAQEMVTRLSGLRIASKVLTGKSYNDPDWKELDMRLDEAEALKDSYQDYLDRTPGMQTTITFKEGEYLKSIYIKTMDDDLSESEEQFIIVLSNATGGAELGEFCKGWVNIADNEEFEESYFELEVDKLTVEAGIPQVSVKVLRTKGIHTMTYVTVGTAGSTAEPNVDYIPASKKLLFLPEVTEQTFTVDLITTYTDEDKIFGIIIDDNRATPGRGKTVVTLAKAPGSYPLYERKAGTKSANNESLLQSTRLTFDYTVASQSSALEKITPYGKMEGEGKYVVMPNDFTIRYGNNAAKPGNTGTYGITINPYAANSSAGVQAPISLAGVKSLQFSWSNTGQGRSWYYHKDWWLFGWHCSSKCGWQYSKEFNSKFVINGPATAPWNKRDYNQYMVKQHHGDFKQETVNLGIKPWMWNSSNIEYWAWNGNENTDNKLNANAVYLSLQPYMLKIENDPSDTGVMARIVTGIDAKGEPVGTGKPVNVGTMRIRNVSRDGNHNTGISDPASKVVYRSDVITFEPVFNKDPSTGKSYADDVYLWGYKIRDRQGNWKYFEGNVLNLNSQWFRENAAAYQDENKGLYAYALLRDDNKDNWSIEVRPVFKAKNETFVKLDIDSSKGSIDGFIDGTNSRVFAISKFDTLKLKVLTKGNATVHNWYVIEDNSNIRVNSLADATTYFNNVNVGSSGNLPTTSSFMANAVKVELNSSNVNPSVKTELTYKPGARFTNIMPSFTPMP